MNTAMNQPIPTLQSTSFFSTLQQQRGFLGFITRISLASFARIMSEEAKKIMTLSESRQTRNGVKNDL